MNEIIVRGPDGAEYRFPAGTSPDVIQRTMQQRYPSPTAAAPAGGDVHEQRPLAGEGEGNQIYQDFFPSLGTGLVQGVAELGMLPITIPRAMMAGGNTIADWVGVPAPFPEGENFLNPLFDLQDQGREWLADTLHQPETTAGEFARTIGEFVPGGAALGPGRFLGNALRYGVVPGTLSEIAGQMTEGTSLEPWARAIGGIFGTSAMAVLANAGAGAGLPGSLGASVNILSRTLRGANLTNAEVTAAEQLIRQGGAQGVALTWPEALSTVTNGRVDATALQRVIEQSRGGQPIMSDVMAGRTAGASTAMAAATSTLGRPGVTPTALGQLAQELADSHISSVRQAINRVTRPLYDAAAPVTIDPMEFGVLYNDPLVRKAIADIRRDPVYSRSVSGYGDDSVAMMDALKKYFEDMAGRSANERTMVAAAAYGQAANDVRQAAMNASPDYADALQQQSILRQDYLAPLEGGPMGTIAGTADLGTQVGALFRRDPFSGSDQEVSQAIRVLSARDPSVAEGLVGQHVEQVFNTATRNLTRGQNQFGPARFVAEIRGNPQQARNLEAAVRALPNGDARWDGFEELLRVLEATGARQPANSATAFNASMLDQMSRGTPTATIMSLIASPTEATGVIRRWYADFRLGRNSEQLARIITDPASAPLLRRLADGGSLRDLQMVAAVLLNQAVSTTPAGGHYFDRTAPLDAAVADMGLDPLAGAPTL